MPSHLTQRDQLRADLASKTTAFLAGGGYVEPVGFRMKDATLPTSQYGRTIYKETLPAPTAVPASTAQPPAQAPHRALIEAAAAEIAEETALVAGGQQCDHQLAVQLLVEAALGKKITPTAQKLGVSLTRCRSVARANHIEFRR